MAYDVSCLLHGSTTAVVKALRVLTDAAAAPDVILMYLHQRADAAANVA